MSEALQDVARSRENIHLVGVGAEDVTLGVAFSKKSRAIHCNSAGTGTVHFIDGTSVDWVFLAGVTYPIAATQVDDVSGSPVLKAVF